jgi:hypothetical protein
MLQMNSPVRGEFDECQCDAAGRVCLGCLNFIAALDEWRELPAARGDALRDEMKDPDWGADHGLYDDEPGDT